MNEAGFRKLDLNLLRLFLVLYETRSPTRAGEILGLTQPAVSHALRRLREHVEDDLFVRHKAGMQPTSRCVDLFPSIERALQNLRTALCDGSAFDPHAQAKTFRILLTDSAQLYFMPKILNIAKREGYKVSFDFVTISSDSGIRLFNEGLVDFAIGYLPDLEGTSDKVHLFDDRLLFIYNKQFGTPDMTAFSDKTVLRPKSYMPGAMNIFGVDHGANKGVNHIYVESFIAIPTIINKMDCVSAFPEMVLGLFEDHANIGYMEATFSRKLVPISLYLRKNVTSYASTRWLINMIKSLD